MMRWISAMAAAGLLSGCAVSGIARVDSAGSPVQSLKSLQAVDLPLALNPAAVPAKVGLQACIDAGGAADKCKGLGAAKSRTWELMRRLGLDSTATDRNEGDGVLVERLRLESALEAFYDPANSVYGTPELRRLRLQERLISASDTNCGIFGQTLYGTQSSLNFAFGSTATVLGGAGAIVTGVDTARLLSGLSSIASGVRAEMNEDFFRKQWVEALIKAIDNERDRRRTDMQGRASEPIGAYPVEAAIADAIRYNNACSLVSGLKEVNQSVAIADDPAGLRAFRDAYSRAGFDARFTVTAGGTTSATSDHLIAGPSAHASGAKQVIAMEIAALRTAADAAKAKVDASALGDATKTQAKADIDKVLSDLYSSTAGATFTLSPYLQQLADDATAYNTLSDALRNETDPDKRADIQAQMRANDNAAAGSEMSARSLISSTGSRIDALVLRDLPPPPAK